MRTLDPKLIPECFKQDEILDRQRNPYKYMTEEQVLYWAEHACDSHSRFHAYLELEKRVGEEKCRAMTRHFTCNLDWMG